MIPTDEEAITIKTFWSRKLIMALVGLLLILGITLAAAWLPALVGIYPTFIGGVIGILSVYMTGNITNKWVVGKAHSKITVTPDPNDPNNKEEKVS